MFFISSDTIDMNPMVEKKLYQDHGRQEKQLYSNKAYEGEEREHTEASPEIPTRQRRMT
jgi:hypothetical protein